MHGASVTNTTPANRRDHRLHHTQAKQCFTAGAACHLLEPSAGARRPLKGIPHEAVRRAPHLAPAYEGILFKLQFIYEILNSSVFCTRQIVRFRPLDAVSLGGSHRTTAWHQHGLKHREGRERSQTSAPRATSNRVPDVIGHQKHLEGALSNRGALLIRPQWSPKATSQPFQG